MHKGLIDQAAQLLARRIGLRSDAAISARLTRAVRDEASALGVPLEEYVAQLHVDQGLLQRLFDVVTVQESAFFRDARQFSALASEVLPGLEGTRGQVHVWSAGCANGQEPYSIAMVLDESPIADWRVLATDVSTTALDRARRAVYSDRELLGVGDERRARHVESVSSRRPVEEAAGDATTPDTTRDDAPAWKVRDGLRSRVEVQRHNLVLDPLPFGPGQVDVVFCRNVLIYLRRQETVDFLHRLSDHLEVGAYLFLGYSESLFQVTDRFELVRIGEAFVYRNAGATSSSGAPGFEPSTSREGAALEPRQIREATKPDCVIAASPRAARASGYVAEEESHEVLVASEFVADGVAAMAGGDHAAAVRSFRKAVFVDPDDETHHSGLAEAFEASGDPTSAIRSTNAARAARRRQGGPSKGAEVATGGFVDTATSEEDAPSREPGRGEARAR